MFIAYAYIGRGQKEVQSAPHETRDAAAGELLTAEPGLASVATCKWFNGRATGSDIQWHNRPDGMAGKHKGFLS